jgi:precorrin-2 dehydrogenase/sirohydrochlorin ferrochelatase
MNYYPIFLDLRGRPCLVVGGGEIATRKVEGLIGAAASVTVISPEASEMIRQHAQSNRLRHIKRSYRDGDLKGYFLAFAATGVAEVDARIACEAGTQGVLLNVVDRPVLCNFITPAVVQRGDLSIAVSTGGKCPGFAKRVKQKIEALIHPEYGIALAAIAAQRRALMRDPWNDEVKRKARLAEDLELIWNKLESASPVGHEENPR